MNGVLKPPLGITVESVEVDVHQHIYSHSHLLTFTNGNPSLLAAPRNHQIVIKCERHKVTGLYVNDMKTKDS